MSGADLGRGVAALKSYYASIDHARLMSALADYVHDSRMTSLLYQYLFISNPICTIRSGSRLNGATSYVL